VTYEPGIVNNTATVTSNQTNAKLNGTVIPGSTSSVTVPPNSTVSYANSFIFMTGADPNVLTLDFIGPAGTDASISGGINLFKLA
jgi:hypothetical protein